jgi:hypoxanthine phosphoribosyltransferase
MKKTWEQFHEDTKKLIEKFGDYTPEIIAPCMLGGLIPSTIIAKELGLNDVRPIDIEREGDERRIVYDVQGEINGKKVLILEDDLPSGKGAELAKKQFEQRGAKVKIAAVYVSEIGESVADFYVEEYSSKDPIEYPWKKFHKGDRLRDEKSSFNASLG